MITDPFTPVFNDLLEALPRLKITVVQQAINLWIIRNAYGRNGNKYAKFSWCAIARDTGWHRSAVSKAGRQLVDRKILVINGSDEIGLNKGVILALSSLSGHVPTGTCANEHMCPPATKSVPMGTVSYPYKKKERNTQILCNTEKAGVAQRDSFLFFWNVYPNRKAKKDALKAWLKLAPRPELVQAILAAVALQAKTDAWTKDDGAFIPLPASWLRGERWNDELPQRKVTDNVLYARPKG